MVQRILPDTLYFETYLERHPRINPCPDSLRFRRETDILVLERATGMEDLAEEITGYDSLTPLNDFNLEVGHLAMRNCACWETMSMSPVPAMKVLLELFSNVKTFYSCTKAGGMEVPSACLTSSLSPNAQRN